MALIIEDGTVVEGANSYASLADIRSYANARGLALGDNANATVESAAIRAMDHIEAKSFIGTKLDTDQPLSWPREDTGLEEEGDDDTGVMPANLVKAQAQLVVDIIAGFDPLARRHETPFATRTKVGEIEQEFSQTTGVSPRLAAFDAFITPLLANPSKLTVRVERG